MVWLVLTLFFLISPVNVYTKSYSDNQIANAIFKAENSKRYPYGIVSINTKGNKKYARKICLNTIRNQRRRHKAHKCSYTYLECLQRRYAPLNVSNDPRGLNKNWLRNVKFFLVKND